METKVCFKCNQELPLDCFYKHKAMKDGRLNKCKKCAVDDVRNNELKNAAYYKEYRTKRSKYAYAVNKDYVKNRLTEWRSKNKERENSYRITYPNKYKSTLKVGNAVRDGILIKENCEVCGNEKSYAHHDDYSKLLTVRWLCSTHHKEWHDKNGEGLNGSLLIL